MKKVEVTKEISEYDKQKIEDFFDKLKKNLTENKKHFEDANNIDIEVTKKKIKLDVLFEIIDKYRSIDFRNLNKSFVVYYSRRSLYNNKFIYASIIK